MRELDADRVAASLRRKGYRVVVEPSFDGTLPLPWVIRTDAIRLDDQIVRDAEHAARLPNVGRAARRKGNQRERTGSA